MYNITIQKQTVVEELEKNQHYFHDFFHFRCVSH